MTSSPRGLNVPGFLRQYVAPLTMRLRPAKLQRRDREFVNEVAFWQDAQKHLLATVHLKGFVLSDWFPRAPGLAHSQQAARAHEAWYADGPKPEEMFSYLNQLGRRSTREMIELARAFDRNEKYVKDADLAHALIETGGLGTIRLLPRSLHGEDYWLGTAVSSGIVALGIPLAVAASSMQRAGVAWGDCVDITGKVRLLESAGLDVIGRQTYRAPPVILFAEEITRREHDLRFAPRPKISPVVLVRSKSDTNRTPTYAFVERAPRPLENSTSMAEQLSEIADRLDSCILTNFDQLTPALADAPLSYQCLLEKRYDEALLLRLARDGGRLVRVVNNINIGAFSMVEYVNNGTAGAFGQNATANNPIFVQQPPADANDVKELAKQLAAVRKEMKKQAKDDSPEQDAEIGLISQAQAAATDGKASEALGFLRSAGKWTLDVSKSVAAKLVEDVIKGELSK